MGRATSWAKLKRTSSFHEQSGAPGLGDGGVGVGDGSIVHVSIEVAIDACGSHHHPTVGVYRIFFLDLILSIQKSSLRESVDGLRPVMEISG